MWCPHLRTLFDTPLRETALRPRGPTVIIRLGGSVLLLVGLLLVTRGTRASSRLTPVSPGPTSQPLPSDLLAGQGSYMVQQLDYYSQHFWARVAGRDTGLPPAVNGHDEFAARWTHDMLANLHGLPVGVFRQTFATPGFRALPASRPGVNIVLAVPGSKRPDHAILIGAHYDGEPTSQGSAYDDTSGCVIMLGLARSLGQLLRARGLPSVTIEFVLFDAEEQGLIGSSAYTFAFRHGALMPRTDIMLDEEQSGAGYPARPFGLLSEPPMPAYALTTGPVPAIGRPASGGVLPPSQAALDLFLRRLTAARSDVFDRLHAAFPSLPYRGGQAPAFTRADEALLTVGPFPQCCSDNAPFEALGLPTATFSGNFDYYRHIADWQFPYDQPQDTFQMLACDTGGSPQPGSALEAALDLPLALSLELIQDYAPPGPGAGIAVFSTMPGAGAGIRFQAISSQPPGWAFGDGSTATGSTVTHAYPRAGIYRLTIHAGTASRAWAVTVPKQQPVFKSPIHGVKPPPLIPWHPAPLQDIPGCH